MEENCSNGGQAVYGKGNLGAEGKRQGVSAYKALGKLDAC